MSLSAISRELRAAVWKRDQARCQYCRLLQVGQAATFHIDHIIPKGKGGPTTLDNLALQCPSCSLYKSNKTAGIDPETGDTVPLFHPLQQAWNDHFQLLSSGVCQGITATGRATVQALEINRHLSVLARALQSAPRLP